MPDRIAIVTGGSRGIGRASAEQLGRLGYGVVVGYTSKPGDAADVVRTIEASGGQAIAVQADVSDEQAVADLFAAAVERFGAVDVVVNAAGLMTLERLEDYTIEQFDRQIAVNLRGAFLVMRAAARTVREGGAIIGISTSIVRRQLPTYAPYAASKAGADGMVLILARELGGRDITVNTIAPGPTATDLYLEGKTEEQLENARSLTPAHRLGEPRDIAEAITFLAGSGGRWVNGQTIFVNGGMV